MSSQRTISKKSGFFTENRLRRRFTEDSILGKKPFNVRQVNRERTGGTVPGMLMVPTLQAVTDSAGSSLNGNTQLELNFADPALKTVLHFQEGKITRVSSDLLPSWSAALGTAGVHPATIAEAQQRGGNLDGALNYLVQGGFLTVTTLARLAHERLVAALLPLVWHNALVSSTVRAPAVAPALPTAVGAAQTVREVEQLAQQLGSAERQLRPSDLLLASPLNPPHGETEGLIYGAALRGLTLGEMARRLPMRWDVLARTATALLRSGVLRAADDRLPRVVSERLVAGQEAPDFCLPDLAGGEQRLSDLRGRPVWLLFNRQSTCALCNPHNAQVITLHERLRQKGVQIVTVWGSSIDSLGEGIGKMRPPYPVLADPQDETYDRYGLSFSLMGTLDGRNMPTLVQGFKMMGTSALKSEGELLRMPAEFLIGRDGVIERAHYNSFGADWLPSEDVLAWADRQATTMSAFWD